MHAFNLSTRGGRGKRSLWILSQYDLQRTDRDTQKNHISNPLPQKIQTFLIRYCPIHHKEQFCSDGINDKERGGTKWYLSLYYRMDTGSFEWSIAGVRNEINVIFWIKPKMVLNRFLQLWAIIFPSWNSHVFQVIL